jgi:hypothetical protein
LPNLEAFDTFISLNFNAVSFSKERKNDYFKYN